MSLKRKFYHVILIGMFVVFGVLGSTSISFAQCAAWTTKAKMLTERFGVSTSVVNGKIYAIGGGRNLDTSLLSTVEEYDPVADKWTKKTDMPTARFSFSTCAVNEKIYAIGGR